MNWRKSAITSAALSSLFLALYGGCNWVTSLRSGVGTWHFEWERRLPFVPWTIWPYLSIDLFFVAAPFICTDERRRVLVKRLVAAIAVACVCFLAMPLRFAFERPAVGGLAGQAFAWFLQLDRPFNLFPSLHVAQALILAEEYVRAPRPRWLRATLLAWFALIVVSTMTTYQHHLIDVIGGLVLGLACMYLFDDVPLRQPVRTNRRVAYRYAAGTLVLTGLAAGLGGWCWALLWPAAATALCTAGQIWLGPGIFRKRAGTISPAARVVTAPVLLGQWLSLQYYSRQSRAWDEVTNCVWLGRRLSDRQAREAVRAGAAAVVDVAAEFSEARPFRQLPAYLQLSVLDLTAPSQQQLRHAAQFIEDHVARHQTVYVHCKAGYSRSAGVVAAWLLITGRAPGVAQAVETIRAARPAVVIRPEILEALHAVADGMPDFAQRTRRRSMATSTRTVSTSHVR